MFFNNTFISIPPQGRNFKGGYLLAFSLLRDGCGQSRHFNFFLQTNVIEEFISGRATYLSPEGF